MQEDDIERVIAILVELKASFDVGELDAACCRKLIFPRVGFEFRGLFEQNGRPADQIRSGFWKSFGCQGRDDSARDRFARILVDKVQLQRLSR